MNKKLIFSIIVAAFLLLNINPTQSSAAYNEKSDWNIRVNLVDQLLKPSGITGNATFELQEKAHELLTNTTGIELDHSYIWIEVNGVKILAVDPIKPTFGKW